MGAVGAASYGFRLLTHGRRPYVFACARGEQAAADWVEAVYAVISNA